MNKDEKLEKFAAMFKIDSTADYPCDTADKVKDSLIKALSEQRDVEDRLQNLDRQIKKLHGMLPAEVVPFAGNKYDSDILSCPCCGGENLHPENTFEGTDSEISGGYGDYTQTDFWCESCPNSIGLRMRFHKGSTMMTWQINDKSTKKI